MKNANHVLEFYYDFLSFVKSRCE